MSDKIYVLKVDQGRYPYRIKTYNPRSNSDPPEWLTDILKFDKLDENGNPIYQKSIDSSSNITYQIPSINGHLSVPNDCLVAINLENREVFSIKIDAFNLLYEEEVSFMNKINKFIKYVFNRR